MPWEPGISANPNGRPPREKTFSNALAIAIKEATKEGGTKLRAVADALVDKAMTGDVPAIKELADRLDGKVAQAVIGGEDGDSPIFLQMIERRIVRPNPND